MWRVTLRSLSAQEKQEARARWLKGQPNPYAFSWCLLAGVAAGFGLGMLAAAGISLANPSLEDSYVPWCFFGGAVVGGVLGPVAVPVFVWVRDRFTLAKGLARARVKTVHGGVVGAIKVELYANTEEAKEHDTAIEIESVEDVVPEAPPVADAYLLDMDGQILFLVQRRDEKQTLPNTNVMVHIRR